MDERERGLSDVIAFTLMFAIIILAVAAVATVGVDQLTELRDREQINSAERAMEGFAATVDDIHRHGDPFRVVELSLGNGGIWVQEATISVSASGTSVDIPVNSLRHRLDGNAGTVTLSYEAGGVFRSDGASPSYEPRVACDPSTGTAVISVVNLTTDDSIDIAGGSSSRPFIDPLEVPGDAPARDTEQSVRFRASSLSTWSRSLSTTSGVSINVSETASPEQWAAYLESAESWTSAGDRKFTCTAANKVLVRNTTIRLSR